MAIQTKHGNLVLSRQRDETITIGRDIQVTVMDIRGDKVRLGIDCPKAISVHRKEVQDAIDREQHEHAGDDETMEIPVGGEQMLVVMREIRPIAVIKIVAQTPEAIQKALDVYAKEFSIVRSEIWGASCPSLIPKGKS